MLAIQNFCGSVIINKTGRRFFCFFGISLFEFVVGEMKYIFSIFLMDCASETLEFFFIRIC